MARQLGKVKGNYHLIVALGLALIITGSAFAYTWTTGWLTVGVGEPTGDITTVNATPTQPDWDDVLTPVTDTIIYRPNATGNETDIEDQEPATGEHWDKVDEVVSDNDTTYISTEDKNWQEDLYHIPDHSTQTAGGDINYVKVYMVSKVEQVKDPAAYVHIKTNGTEYNGTSESLTTSYATYSYQWTVNSSTNTTWTWDEIDALEIGVGLVRPKKDRYTRCTQNYVEVEFEAPPLSGNTPTGDLFEVTAHDDYSGDLQVGIYLTNTDSLQKAYDYLNMELYLEGSEEAGETPNYQLLNLTDGVATFNLVGISGGSYTLSVNGGTYQLRSREVSEWEEGYTVTLELYCEVAQR
ncbi:hypothetical protein ACFLW4_04925 [Chloroflexota bacterium]